MKIAYTFLSDAATISALTQDDNFPVANVKDGFLSVRYKPTAVTGQYVDFDFGAATSIDCLCLASNLTSSATITVQHDDNAAFTSPATIAIVETGETIIFESFTSASDRYWRVNFADATLSEIEIDRLVLTTKYTMPDVSIRPTVDYVTTSSVRFSNSGQAHGVGGYEYYAYDLTFQNPTKTQRETLETIFATVKNYTPIFADIFEEGEFPPDYVVIDQDSLAITVQTYGGYSLNMRLRSAY